MFRELTIARILLAWITLLMTFIAIMSYNDTNVQPNIGPSDSLIIFGTPINTNKKYAGVVVLCIFNSAIRTMNSNIIHAWVINNVQDTKIYFKVNTYHAYEITGIHAVYSFVDWYFYMNIILSQVDLFLIEMSVDFIMAILTTRYYLKIKDELLMQQMEMKIQMELQTINPLSHENKKVKNYILTSQNDVDI